ncbi:MAG: hypothetical protein JNK82_12305 [Myxococcaceae bacterium]|nr:hypothetical protein [Myxococcaceae bacterium]
MPPAPILFSRTYLPSCSGIAASRLTTIGRIMVRCSRAVTATLLSLLVCQAPLEGDAQAATLVPRDVAVLRASMHTYVTGERRSIIPFAVSAVVTMTSGGLLLLSSDPIARGAAWPLLGFGVLELAAGLFFGIRNERPKLDAQLDADPVGFVRDEREKMRRISRRNQPLLLALWSAVTAAGGVLAGVGAARDLPTVTGVGLGLVVQGLSFFLIDWAVLDRADEYLAVLDSFG